MLTTQQVLQALQDNGMPISQKLMGDYVRRGLLIPPVRKKLQQGGRGSQSYWDPRMVERLQEILAMRQEGLGYDEIHARVVGAQAARRTRLGVTVWLPDFIVADLEAVSRTSRVPVVHLLQLGARLYNEAPHAHRGFDLDPQQLRLIASNIDALPDSERVFIVWARFATRYYETLFGLQQGELPSPAEAYVFWRLIQDGMIAAEMLTNLGISQEDILVGDQVVAQLTTFRGGIRMLKPVGDAVADLELCLGLAKKYGAVLVTGEGHDFNHAGAAQALARVGDWIREEATNG